MAPSGRARCVPPRSTILDALGNLLMNCERPAWMENPSMLPLNRTKF